MSCKIKRDKNNEIISVLAPNNKPSLLFSEINKLTGNNKEASLKMWAQVYTPQFLMRYGNWLTVDSETKAESSYNPSPISLDSNGEPLLKYLDISEIKPKEDVALERKIKVFLGSIGVSLEEVKDTLPSGAVAQADFLNKIVHVVRDKADISTLGEEAAHFFIRMLPETSTLKKDLLSAVTSYPLYKEVLQTYGSNPYYQINGKPNFEKIKEETAGKLISLAMKGDLSYGDNISKQNKIKEFLNRIIKYINSIFHKSNINNNPFITASKQILSSKIEGLSEINEAEEDNIMFQLSSDRTPEQNFQSLSDTDNKLDKKDSSTIDPETGEPMQKYHLNGKEIKRRVTDLVKEFYKKTFGSIPVDRAKREIYALQAQKGTNIHNDLEDIGLRYTTAEGKLRDIPEKRTKAPHTSEKIYDLLEKHLSSRLKQYVQKYGPETRFMFEVKIYDAIKDMAGTIDLLVLKPSGRVDILDWKSSDFSAGKVEKGVAWWKEEAYTIQLDEYARILHSNYGIETDLRRAIPIRAMFSKDPKTNNYTSLSGIEIGDAIISNIPEIKSYLLPVPSRTESTGLKAVDDLLDKLRVIYNEIKDKKVTIEDKLKKNQELEKIKKAITALQIKQSLDGLVENGLLLKENIEAALNDKKLDLSKAQTYYKEIQFYTNLTKLMSVMEQDGFGNHLSSNQKELIYLLQGASLNLEEQLKKFLLSEANKIASETGITNLQEIEKGIGWWAGMIRSISNSPNKTVQTFYKYLTKFQDHIYQQRDGNNEKLASLKANLNVWAQQKGISHDHIFDGILEIDDKNRWNGNFIYRYSKEFRELKQKYINERNTQELIKLLDLSAEAESKFRDKQKKFKEWLDSAKFSLDTEKDKKIKENKLKSWNFQYNVFEKPYQESALLNYNNGIQGKSTYYSPKWKELLDPSNAPLKAAYDYFQQLLNTADKKLSMIDNNGRFIPNIENDKLDMYAQYGNLSILNLKGFFESYEYKTNAVFGEIDPITGKPKRTIPKLFLNNLSKLATDKATGEQYLDFQLKSKDLFSVFSIWGKHMAEYQYMSQMEEIGSLMLTVEDIKGKHLQKGRDGKYLAVKGNEDNLQYLQDFVDYYVYSHKLKDTNAWEFNLLGKTYSGKRLIQGVIRYMGMKTLAFNTTSIMANYVGGKFNTFFVATSDTFFNKKHWAHGEWAMSTDLGKAFIDYFDVFLEDESFHRSRQLSVFSAVRNLSYDNLFIGQRVTDKLVQYASLLAMTKSYGVINGKIVNIKEHVQQELGYASIFNLPAEEQTQLQSKIKARIKELEEELSLWNISKIEDGKLHVPGLTRKDDTVMHFRLLVKRANKTILGNATSDDISRYRMSLLGQALGQFRNWMPALIDARFSELRYDVDDDAWIKGKFRSLFSNYFSTFPSERKVQGQILTTLAKHVAVLTKDIIGFTSYTNIQQRAKLLFAAEKLKAIEQGISFDISEHAFIELHIKNMRSMLAELRLIIAFTAFIFAMVGSGSGSSGNGDDDRNHDDDDNDHNDHQAPSGMAKYIRRMLDKFNNELLFYYLPTNFTQLIQSPIPVVSLAEDITKFFSNLAGQTYATITGNEGLDKKYKPTKYLFKDIPIAREVYNLGTIFNEDMRRSYEVTR